MKICILSGRYPRTNFNSSMNHKIYADKFGYSYIHCNWPTQAKNPYINKINYILSYFDLFDYVIWIDDDAFFFDFEKDIMNFAPTGDNFISLCKSPSYKELKTHFSSGQFILKTSKLSRKFLEKVIDQEMGIVKEWWTDKFGFFTNGDQDKMVYLFQTDTQFKNKYTLYDYKEFNSRIENLFNIDEHKPFILHFTGKPEVKRKNYQKVQKEYDLHSSLVPFSLLKENNIYPSKKKNQKKQMKIRMFIHNIIKCLKG